MVDVVTDIGGESSLVASPDDGLKSPVWRLPENVQRDLVSAHQSAIALERTQEVDMALDRSLEAAKRTVRERELAGFDGPARDG
jgi:hypothetical protein